MRRSTSRTLSADGKSRADAAPDRRRAHRSRRRRRDPGALRAGHPRRRRGRSGARPRARRPRRLRLGLARDLPRPRRRPPRRATTPTTRCARCRSSSPSAAPASASSPAATRPGRTASASASCGSSGSAPTELEFSGVDLFDGTPVLDIKPWVSDFDLPTGAAAPAGTRCGWFDTLAARPMTLDDPAALVLVARELAGRAAMVVRSVALDGLGAAAPGRARDLRPARLPRRAAAPRRARRRARTSSCSARSPIRSTRHARTSSSSTSTTTRRVGPASPAAGTRAGRGAAGRPRSRGMVGRGRDAVVRSRWSPTSTRSARVPSSTSRTRLLDAGRSRGVGRRHRRRSHARRGRRSRSPVSSWSALPRSADDLVDLASWLGMDRRTAAIRTTARAELAPSGRATRSSCSTTAWPRPARCSPTRSPGRWATSARSGRAAPSNAALEHLRGLGVDRRRARPAPRPRRPRRRARRRAREIALSILAEITAVRERTRPASRSGTAPTASCAEPGPCPTRIDRLRG